MSEKISNQCIIGSAIISSSGHVFMADTGFHAFAEYDVIESLRAVVIPEDWKNFEDAIDMVKREEFAETIFRIQCESGEIKKVIAYIYDDKKNRDQLQLAKMVGIAYADDDEGGIKGLKAYRLEITSIESMTDKIEELENRLKQSNQFLEIMNSVLITYDIADNELKIFSTEKTPTYFFVGNLDEFVRSRQDNGLIFEEHILIFEELIDDFRKGQDIIRINLKSKFLGVEDDYKWYDINGVTVTCDDGTKKVIARLELISDGHVKEDIQKMVNTKDFGTGLVNKGTILGYARNLIESQPDHDVAIAIIDLDNFKNINDTYGHKFGDEVLAKTAHIIQDAVGNHGMVGRIGGDEMFIVYDNLENKGELRGLLRTIRTNVEWSYKGIRDDVEVSCSIGAATYPVAGKTFDELFNVADKLLYLAKEKGRNRYIMYVPEYHEQYIKGNANVSTTLREVEKMKYNKDGIVAEVLETAFYNKCLTDEEILEKVMNAFELDVMSVIDGKTNSVIKRASVLANNVDVHDYLEDEGFQDLFDDIGICKVNSITFVEMWSKRAFEVLKKENVSSLIQYRHMVNGEIKGYISFGRSRFNRKWTELDIAMLAVIGKVYALTLFK